MKFCRFQPQIVPAEHLGVAAHPEIFQGVVSGEIVREVSGDILGRWSWAERSWPLAMVKLLPPVTPSKIFCLGRSYAGRGGALKQAPPKEPLIFLKPATSVLAPEDPITLPPSSQNVDCEGKLAVVISRPCSYLGKVDDVRPYIAGYTCLNDVSAWDSQVGGKQWTRAKALNAFCPIGPVLETEFDVASGRIETLVNGVTKQSFPLSALAFPVDVIIQRVSQVTALWPGDVVAAGAGAGAGPIAAGEVVEVIIPGVGALRNPVMACLA